MERSEQVGDLIVALAKAQAEFTFASKDSSNPAYNAKYADLAANISAVRPALSKHGIALMQFDQADITRQTASVTTALHHGEQWISVTVEAPAAGRSGFNVQSLGACWTYLRRYTLQAICGLASDDDDGNSLMPDPEQAEVHAEVKRQKASRPDITQEELDAVQKHTYLPPELDWSYQKTTGVLICRIMEVKLSKKKAGGDEYVALRLNRPIDGKDAATYFHTTHRELLLGSVGKIVKLMIQQSKSGYVNVDDVLEVDGVAILNPVASPEMQARLLASMLEMTEDELQKFRTEWCDSSWPLTLKKLKDEQQARYSAAEEVSQ
jgi:hypothetical protein